MLDRCRTWDHVLATVLATELVTAHSAGEVGLSFPVEPPEQLLSRLAGWMGPGEPH
ncbi:MAG: hypothetical protein QOI75_6031, partial [Pseudonocardiales bacterium]|nr:hypothetical protein [Pseudonocardiales bacterium]